MKNLISLSIALLISATILAAAPRKSPVAVN